MAEQSMEVHTIGVSAGYTANRDELMVERHNMGRFAFPVPSSGVPA
jgi:hypothetical protein